MEIVGVQRKHARRDAMRERALDAVLDRADHVRMLADAGMEIGFHTLRHHNLTLLSDEQLARALTEGRTELEDAVGSAIDVICYPYGFADERVADAARSAGFRTGFTGEPLAVIATEDPLLCGRIAASPSSFGRFVIELPLALARR